MVDILGFISEQLTDAGIPYEFGEWTQAVSYPYFVGSYDETDYFFEDDQTTGTFTLDGWGRGESAKLALAQAADTIKDIFSDLQTVQDDRLFFIRYGGSNMLPSGEENLFHVMITLFLQEWKG